MATRPPEPAATRIRPPATDDPPVETTNHDAERERRLIAAAKRDRNAVAPLYTRYLDPVYRYCYRRLGGREAAEDATSRVFAKALVARVVRRLALRHRPQRRRRHLPHGAARPTARSRGRGRRRRARSGGDRRRRRRAALPGPTPRPPRLPADQRRVVELRLAGLTAVYAADSRHIFVCGRRGEPDGTGGTIVHGLGLEAIDLESGVAVAVLKDARLDLILPSADGQRLYVVGPKNPLLAVGSDPDQRYLLRRLDTATLAVESEREFPNLRLLVPLQLRPSVPSGAGIRDQDT